MKIGIIGTGSMGTMLIEAFIEAGAITADEINITNRTIKKALAIKKRHPSIHVSDLKTVITKSDLIFIAVKPKHFPAVIQEVQTLCHENQIVVSITSPISTAYLEHQLRCKIARIIPSILNEIHEGATLITFGESCDNNAKETLLQFMGKISTPVLIENHVTRVASDISSCGPAFFSYLLLEFIHAAVRQTSITEEQATILTINMLNGLSEMLKKEEYTLQKLIERVSVPGGITTEGIAILSETAGASFDQLFQKTKQKFENESEHFQVQ